MICLMSSSSNARKYKLILIDHRVNDIEGLINSTNDDTYCLVFNYFYDTYATILSKLRFLSGTNTYILDRFYYEEPTPPTQMDASGNHCTPCDGFDALAFELIPETLYAEHLEFMLPTTASATTAWPFYAEGSTVKKSPVFFQRPRTKTDAPDVYVPRPFIYINNLDAIYDLAVNANEVSTSLVPLEFDTVGIIQHATLNDHGYKLVDAAETTARVANVAADDPQLESWSSLATFIQTLKTVHGLTTLDLMACALYVDTNWKYVIDVFASQQNITIRASNDNTGAAELGGNWILETADVNLTSVYFTSTIYNWKYVLATYIDNRFYALRFNNSLYAYRTYDAKLKIGKDTSSFTIETWYYETALRTGCTIVDMGDYNYTFQIRNAGQANPVGLSFYSKGLNSNNWLYADDAIVPVAQWSHIAMTRSGSTFKFFINGVKKQTIDATGNMAANDSLFTIGQQSPVSCYCNLIKLDCSLYDLRLWNVTRSETEIQMYRNRILPSNTTGLVANYLCTDNAATFSDRTANALNATLNAITNAWIFYFDTTRWTNSLVAIPNVGFLISNGYSLTSYNGTALNAVSHFGNMTYTDFTSVDFTDVNFSSADLTGSNFTNCNFTRANFNSANMTSANFTGANLTSATSSSATLQNATINVISYSGPTVGNVAIGMSSLSSYTTVNGSVPGYSFTYSVTADTNGCISSINTSTGTLNLSGNTGTVTVTIRQTSAFDLNVVLTIVKTPVLNGFNAGVATITKYYSDIGGTFTVTSPTSTTPNIGTPSYSYSIVYATNGPPNTPVTASVQSQSSSSAVITVAATGQCVIRVTKAQDLASFLDTAVANVSLTVRPGYIVGPSVDMTGAVIQNYDLTGTNLSGVAFTNASIINCILDGANLTSADFTGATFTYNRINATTNLTSANFQNLVSGNISGTTALISSTWEIQSGQIVASGTILFALTFTMASASPVTLGGLAGNYYEVTANSLRINDRAETPSVSTNIVVKALNTTYVPIQTGLAPTYKFALYLQSSNNTFYVQARDIGTNAVMTLPYAATPQTFAVSFLVDTTSLPTGFHSKGSYIFGPNMSLDGMYFDNTINPKPDLTGLILDNLTLSNSTATSQIVLSGWNLTSTKLNSGIFRNIMFQDCICNATDFSGSSLDSSSFTISYDSAVSATPNTATLQNAKFTNASIFGLTIAGYNNSATVAANQMNVSGLDFSGCVIRSLKSSFLAGTPVRMKNAYDGPEYTMLTDSLIGRFVSGPAINLSNFTLGNAAFVGTNLASSNIYGTKLSSTTMTGVRVSNGRLTHSSLTTTLPSNFKIVTPLLSATSTQYTVTNSGTGAYVINGQNNPTITLIRGSSYTFNISASGHPFWIKTAATTGPGDAYVPGVTNNGISSGIGTTTFVVPANAPNTLYYKCELHSSMGGIITISDEINTEYTYIIGPSADLSGVDATGVIFTGANISGANFTNANFRNVVSGALTSTPTPPTLPSADYSVVGGYFVGPYVDLSGSNLAGASLANTNVTGANFTNAILTGVKSGGISSTAIISGVTATVAPTLPAGYGLTGGYIIGPNMNFIGADLSGFDLTNVNLSGTTLAGANITYVKSGNTLSSESTVLPDASHVFLNNYLLGPQVNLSAKDLSGMQFYSLSLSGSIFVNTNFTGADISGTILDGANFTGAIFTRTQSRNIPQPSLTTSSAPTFTAGTAGGYVIRNGYLIGANVDLSSVNFTGLDLSNTVLTNANLANATFTGTRSGGITFNALTPPLLPAKYNVVGGYLHGPRVDLSGANLTSYDFGTSTNSINWSDANLTNATFTNMKSGWITIDSVGSDASGPILSYPYVYNRLVSVNASGGFIIGPNVSLNSAPLTGYDLRNVIDITGVDFTNAALTGVKTSGSIVASAGNRPTFTGGSGYVLYAGRIFGPGVDVSGTDLSGLVFGSATAATAAGSTAALSATNFTNANLTRVSMYGSVVTGTVFTGATFYRTRTGGLSYATTPPIMPTPNYRYVATDAVTGSGGYIIGPDVDLSGTNLRGAAFTNTNFSNVDMSGAALNGSVSDNVTYDASTNLPAGYKFITNKGGVNFIVGPNISLAGKTLDSAIIANVDLTNTAFANAGSVTTFVGTRSGGITYTTGQPPTFQSGSGYQIRGGYLVGPSVDLSNITVAALAAANDVAAYGSGLMGVDLSGVNLAYVKFTGSDLSGANLYGATLSYADFSGASFINIKSGGRLTFASQPILPSASYKFVTNGYAESDPASAFQRYIVGPDANCRSADFSGAVFDRVDLSGVDFTGANFTRVTSGIMRNTPLLSTLPNGFALVSGSNTQLPVYQDPSYNNALYFVGPTAILRNAYLRNASIADCDVTGADFTNADFTNVASRGLTNSAVNPATLPSASFYIKSGYIFGPRVNLSGGDFTGLDLSGSVFIGAKFTNATFTNANLTGVDITSADLSGSTLTGAKTTRVTYQGYNYGTELSTQDPTFPAPYRYVYSDAAKSGCIFGPYVDVSGADLRGANLAYSNATGINLTGANLTGVKSGNVAINNGVQPIFSAGSGFKFLSGYLIGPYADLTGIVFTDQDFSGTNLTGVDFTNSVLLNVKSGNIVAAPVLPIFPDVTFSLRGGYIIGPGVDLSNSDLSGVDLSNVTITNANMLNSGLVNIRTGGVKGTTPFLRPTYMQRNGYIIGTGVDLSGADLSGQNLANAYFTNANISNAIFTNSILTTARSGGTMRYSAATIAKMPTKYTIRGTYIVGPGVDLSGDDLTGVDVSGTFLSGANLTNAVFTNVRSGNIEMLDARPIVFSLDPAYYGGSEYGYVYLNGYIVGPRVDLSGSDFSGVNIASVDISGANLTNSRLINIQSSNIAGQPSAITSGYKVTARHIIGPNLDLSGYDFTNGDFSGADISGSDLTNAIFVNTKSGGVSGSGSAGTKFTTTTIPTNVKYQLSKGYIVGPSVNLSEGDLSGVDVSGINLSNVVFYNTQSGKVVHNAETMLPTNYAFIGDYIVGPDVNLSTVDFSGADLRYLNLTNVNFGSANLYNVRSGYIVGVPKQLPPTFSFISGFIVGPSTDLSGADLSGGDIGGCNIQGADLTNANFYNVRSGGVQGVPRSPLNAPYAITLNGYVVGNNVNLNGANLASIDMRGLTLSNAIMTDVSFANAKFGGNFGPPRVLTAPYIFVQTELSGGYVVGPYIDLSNANFSHASIASADLTGANVGNAVFYHTRSGGMNASGVPSALTPNYSIMATTLSGGYLVGPNVNLNDANFTDSEFQNQNVAGALMERIVFDGARMGGGGLIGPPAATSFPDYRYVQSSVSGGYIIGPRIDLSGANLSNTDMSFTRIDGMNFTNVNFTNTHSGRLLVSPSAQSTQSAQSTYTPPILPSPYRLILSSISGGYIVGPYVNMHDANLTDTDISNTTLTGINLGSATFTNMYNGGLTAEIPTFALPTLPARYRYVTTTASGDYIVGPGLNLTGANLAGSDISHVDLYGCDVSMTKLPPTLTYVRSGMLRNTPAVLPAPYLFIGNDVSGSYIVGPYSDLSGANLTGSVVTGADLDGADFTNARLSYLRSGGLVNAHPPAALPASYLFVTNDTSGAYIVGPRADLSGANLTGSVITGADLDGADFTNARLTRIRSGGMVNAHPPAALPNPYIFVPNDTSGAYIVGPYADLSGANLTGSVITGADISGADFTNTRLSRIRSGGLVNAHPPAVLPSPYLFITNDASGAYIVGPYSDLSGANLTGSVVTGADLDGADFTNARLAFIRSGGMVNAHPPAILPNPYIFVPNDNSGAYIVGPYADLSGANLSGSVVTGADLDGADFTNALLAYVRSGGMVNAHPPAILPSPYLFITNDTSGAYIVGPYADLSGANLTGSSVTGADLDGADFTNTLLAYVRSGGLVNAHRPVGLPSPYLFIPNDASGAYIVGPRADLSGANLTGSVVTGADLAGADFTNARLLNVRSGGLSIVGPPAALPATYNFVVSAVTASGGYLIGTGADISGAVLTGTDLSGITFTGTIMQNARLDGATLVNAKSGGIRGAPALLPAGYTFVNDNSSGGYIVGSRVDLSGADLTNCVLSGMDVSGANLTGAITANTKLGPNLIGPPAAFPTPAYKYLVSSVSGGFIIGPDVNLQGANLAGADLSGYNFAGVNVTGVDFSGALLDNVKSGRTVGPPFRLPSPYVFMTDNSFGAYIVGPRVDLTGANLTDCQFTGLNIAGATFTGATLTNVKTGGGMVGPPATNALPPKYRFIVDVTDGTGGYFIGPGVNLTGATLRNLAAQELAAAYFTDANISNAQLSGSSIPYVKSGGMTGTPASLPASYSYIVSASGGYIMGPYADLSGANLNNTTIAGVNILHADLTNVTFVNTRSGGLIGPPDALAANYHYVQASVPPAEQDAYIVGPRINLTAAVLSRTNLTNMDLSGANLTSAVFTGTNFTNTNIVNTNLSGIVPFTNTQRLQLLKNRNNRDISSARTSGCRGGEIDMIAATSTVPNTYTYDPIFDYIRDQSVDVLTPDSSGNSILSAYTGRIFYIPSVQNESFYVDASATTAVPAPLPVTLANPQYYYDADTSAIIETLTGNVIRSIGVGGRTFLVFGGSMLGIVIDDVYTALGFPPVFKTYAYYGVRNLVLPSQVHPLNTVVGDRQISLNWSPSFVDGKPRLGYIIEYSTQKPVADFYVPWIAHSEQYALTNVTIPGLINGTTYYFRVAANSVIGRGPYSPVVHNVPGAVPDRIGGLFVNGGDSTFTLEWTDPYNQGYAITSYSIRYRQTTTSTLTIAASSVTSIAMSGGNTRSYALQMPIQNGVSYDVQIAATNFVGTGAYGTMSSPDPVYAVAGSAPGSISAATTSDVSWNIVISDGGGKARLAWRPPSIIGDLPVYAYSIQLAALPSATVSVSDASWNIVPRESYTVLPDTGIGGLGGLGVYAIVPNLINGTAYRFRIAAINGVGRGPYSSPIPPLSPVLFDAVVPGSTPARLLLPQLGVSADTATGAKLTLFWNRPDPNGYPILAYKARIREAIGGAGWSETPPIVIAITDPPIVNTLPYRNYAFTGLINGTDYAFGVASRNQLGYSEFSETILGTPRTVPQPPTTVFAQPNDTALRVSWVIDGGINVNNGGYPIIGYRVQYRPITVSSSLVWRIAEVDGIYNTSAYIENLVNGVSYEIRVLRQNAIGYSAPTASIYAIPGTVATPPAGLFLSVGPNRITAYWQAPISTGTNAVEYYYLQYKRVSDPTTSYVFLNDVVTGLPKRITDVSLIPNPPDYNGYIAVINDSTLLANGVNYNVRVAAVTQVGVGVYCEPGIAIPGTVPSQIE